MAKRTSKPSTTPSGTPARKKTPTKSATKAKAKAAAVEMPATTDAPTEQINGQTVKDLPAKDKVKHVVVTQMGCDPGQASVAVVTQPKGAWVYTLRRVALADAKQHARKLADLYGGCRITGRVMEEK